MNVVSPPKGAPTDRARQRDRSQVSAHLAVAVGMLGISRARALLCGDRDQADRLGRLADLIGYEAEYAEDRDRGRVEVVLRRADAPDGATIGWWLVHDPAVRALRQLHGLPCDYSKAVA